MAHQLDIPYDEWYRDEPYFIPEDCFQIEKDMLEDDDEEWHDIEWMGRIINFENDMQIQFVVDKNVDNYNKFSIITQTGCLYITQLPKLLKNTKICTVVDEDTTLTITFYAFILSINTIHNVFLIDCLIDCLKSIKFRKSNIKNYFGNMIGVTGNYHKILAGYTLGAFITINDAKCCDELLKIEVTFGDKTKQIDVIKIDKNMYFAKFNRLNFKQIERLYNNKIIDNGIFNDLVLWTPQYGSIKVVSNHNVYINQISIKKN